MNGIPAKITQESKCFSSTKTLTPARAGRYPNIMPAGPPPAMQQRREIFSDAMFFQFNERRLIRKIPVRELSLDHGKYPVGEKNFGDPRSIVRFAGVEGYKKVSA